MTAIPKLCRDASPVFALAVLAAASGGDPGPLRAQSLNVAEAPAPRPPYGEAVDSARSILRTFMAVQAVPGLSVAVGEDGRVLWSEGLGWADVEHRVPVTPLTRFRVGSVSKPLPAAALALLVEEGRVDLDAPVRRYVPEFGEKRWAVSPRQLAGHVAGASARPDGPARPVAPVAARAE